MDTKLSEEQGLLKDSVAKFVQSSVSTEKVRELADNPVGLTDDLWAKIAEQGWLGLIIPEDDGGLGLGVQELGVVCEEFGKGAVPGPFLSTVLASHAIAKGGNAALKGEWLEKIAGGEAKGTLALLEQDATLGADAVSCEAKASGDGWTLNGKKYLVADAVAADVFVVAARTGRGVALFAVPKATGGVSVAENKLTDMTSRSGQVTLSNVSVTGDALIGADGDGWSIVEDTLLIANIAIAADSLAGAEFIHKLTVAYAKERQQFGKLIGTFQAVKHPLAELFGLIESARSAYHYAGWCVDAKTDNAKSAAAVARYTCTEVYRKTCLDCLQAHGGIAFTWEYDLHLYLKRAKHNQFLYGVPHDYEEIVVTEALGI